MLSLSGIQPLTWVTPRISEVTCGLAARILCSHPPALLGHPSMQTGPLVHTAAGY